MALLLLRTNDPCSVRHSTDIVLPDQALTRTSLLSVCRCRPIYHQIAGILSFLMAYGFAIYRETVGELLKRACGPGGQSFVVSASSGGVTITIVLKLGAV